MISLKVAIIALLNFIAVVYSQNTCFTPNGEQAQCVPFNRCRLLFNAIYDSNPRTRQFLRDSQCSTSSFPYVCCGSVVGYVRQQYLYQNPQIVRTQAPQIEPFRRRPNQFSSQSSSQSTDPKRHRNINLLPRSGICGRQSLVDKIVGGTETSLDEFPWLALLGYRNGGRDVGFHCGGMLINERYVLTAAHCVTGEINRFYGNVYQVRLGEHDTRQLEDCTFDGDCNDPPQDVVIEEVTFHTGYDDRTRDKYNDIALLRLRRPVRLSFFVQPICLPLNNEQTSPGKNMSVAGWGKTEFESVSNVKLKASVPYVDRRQCNNAYQGITISDNQLCAGGQIGVDSCNGDSGGPIMNLLADQETWYAEGLVSFGPTPCGAENRPGVYTRIYNYLNWILDHMRS